MAALLTLSFVELINYRRLVSSSIWYFQAEQIIYKPSAHFHELLAKYYALVTKDSFANMPLRNSHSQIENQIDSFIQNFKRNSAVFVSQLNLDSYGASLRHTFSAGQISPTTDYGTKNKRSSFVSTYSSSSRRTSTDGTNLSFSEAESYDEEADISESSSGKYILSYYERWQKEMWREARFSNMVLVVRNPDRFF